MQALALNFSTNNVHPRDRFDLWHAMACRSYVEHECRAREPLSFTGHVDVAPLAHSSLSSYSSSASRVWRTSRQAASDRQDDIFICIQTTGATRVSQDGRDAFLNPGDICLVDTAGTYVFEQGIQSAQTILRVPRGQLVARFPRFRGLTATNLREGTSCSLAGDFILMISRYRDRIAGLTQQRIADQAVDLTALTLAEIAGPAGLNLTSSAASGLLRLRQAVEINLANRSLRCADIAAAAGMSLRYANSLLLQEGTSLERLIQHRRLEKCREALRNPAEAGRNISEIAFAWGFADAAHFARSFKSAYGLSPSDYRRQELERCS